MGKHSLARRGVIGRTVRSTKVRALLSLGVVIGFGSVGTLAYWTDAATVGGGTFTSGTLDIKLDGSDDNPPGFASAFAFDGMEPGDSKAAVLDVENAGSVAFTYTVTGRAPGALAPFLTFRVVPGGTLAGDSCTGTSSFDDTLGGSQVPVSSAARTIEPGEHESFCVAASMPAGTTGGQGLSTDADFVFDAKQVGAP